MHYEILGSYWSASLAAAISIRKLTALSLRKAYGDKLTLARHQIPHSECMACGPRGSKKLLTESCGHVAPIKSKFHKFSLEINVFLYFFLIFARACEKRRAWARVHTRTRRESGIREKRKRKRKRSRSNKHCTDSQQVHDT